jgi:hypothetical protein
MAAGNYRWWVVAMLWLVCLFNYAGRPRGVPGSSAVRPRG